MVQNEAINRIEEWKRLLQEADDSELTRKQWCKEKGIPERKFYYWQKKIRGGESADAEDAGPSSSRVGTFCELEIPMSLFEGSAPSAAVDVSSDALILECGPFRLQIPQAFLMEVLKNA